jgi:hypothetical protein
MSPVGPEQHVAPRRQLGRGIADARPSIAKGERPMKGLAEYNEDVIVRGYLARSDQGSQSSIVAEVGFPLG